jgi:hypothetical protein
MTDISHTTTTEVKPDSELGHDQILLLKHWDLHPSPENDKLYRPVDEEDPEIVALANSISENGILEPLVVSIDRFIISGHRRYAAAGLAGITLLPCRVANISRTDDPDRFISALREHNRQREKSFDEKLREEVVTVDPTEAYQSLIEHRKRSSKINVTGLDLGEWKPRAEISKAKAPFLEAIKKLVDEDRDFWPLSVRQIHYRLLNNPPLRHASKPDSIYQNDMPSYKSLVDLITRARLDYQIEMEAIADETRPITTWAAWSDVRSFVRKELGDLLKGYWRNLMHSQPNHIELVVEKNTIASIAREVALKYCIPVTTGRGFCSLPPRHQMAERFKASGKETLIVLIASDFDPDGEQIAQSFARSMRDDFGVENIHPIKVALTADQVRRFNLPPQMLAKETSVNYAKFVEKYGENVFELEAVPPRTLQQLITEAIDSVIDRTLFNQELDQEKSDAAELGNLRARIARVIGGIAA